MAAYVPKTTLDSQSVGAEIKRLAEHVNVEVVKIANVAAVATANGSDAGTTQTLANALKTKVNELITAINATGKAANIAAVATANGSDPATTQALANALKTKVNEILTALKAAGVMTAD